MMKAEESPLQQEVSRGHQQQRQQEADLLDVWLVECPDQLSARVADAHR